MGKRVAAFGQTMPDTPPGGCEEKPYQKVKRGREKRRRGSTVCGNKERKGEQRVNKKTFVRKNAQIVPKASITTGGKGGLTGGSMSSGTRDGHE